MSWMWWAGAVAALLCSVPCGINLGMRVASGKEAVWSRAILSWAIGFHGLLGVAALVMVMQAKG